MKRRFASIFIGCFVLLLAPVSAVQAAKPLEAFPDTIAFVIRFESVDKFLGNTNDMLAAISPVAAAAAPNVERVVLGEMFDLNDRIGAIDRTCPSYIALFPFDGPGPPAACLVKPADEDEIKRAMLRTDDLKGTTSKKRDDGFTQYTKGGRSCYIAPWADDYIIYTRFEEVANAMSLGQKDRRTIADVLDENAKGVYQSGNAAVAVNSAHLAVKFKSEIEEFRKQILRGIEDLPEEQLGPSADTTKKMYTKLANLGFDALYDSTWVVGRTNLSAEGAEGEALAGFKENSKTDQFLASHPTSTFETLGLLPGGGSALVGMAFDYATFSMLYLQAGLDGGVKDRAAADAAIKKMHEANVKSTVASYGFPGENKSGMLATTYQEAGDAAKLRRGYLDYMRAIGEMKSPLFNMSFDYAEQAEEYKEHKIDLMKMSFKVGEGEPAAVLKSFYDKLFGGEHFETRLATVGSLFVQATGNDAGRMRQVLEGLNSGEGVVGLEDAYGKTRDKLAENANFVLLLDGPRLVIDAVNMIRDVEPFAAGLRQAPFNFGLKPTASYGGVSLGAEPQTLRVKAFVPVEQPRGMLQIFMPGI